MFPVSTKLLVFRKFGHLVIGRTVAGFRDKRRGRLPFPTYMPPETAGSFTGVCKTNPRL